MIKMKIAVDGIIKIGKNIVLVKRANEPFKNKYALPGGFIKFNEKISKAVSREIREEIGLIARPIKLIGIYDNPKRDPRGRVISLAFLCKVFGGKLKKGSDAKDVGLFNAKEVKKLKLAFDHKKIIKDFYANKTVC